MRASVNASVVLFLILSARASRRPSSAGARRSTQEQVQRQQASAHNARVWRDVRSTETPVTRPRRCAASITVVVQKTGETCAGSQRPLTIDGGWFLVFVVLARGAFYWWRG